MATFLFDKVIFGPIRSRRLGLSLGINLLNPSAKHCNFDCIYCECGWNAEHRGGTFNSKLLVLGRLETKLKEMVEAGELPDVITFAGNGEPTMHPDFESIIDGTIALRDQLVPSCKIAVLSNATMIDSESVRRALLRVDRNILKLDSAFEDTIKLVNQPNSPRSVAETVELMKRFDGHLIIQTMFLRGVYNGQVVDNTTEREVGAWLELLSVIRPESVMVYSLDRDTPASGLVKVEREELEVIAARVAALGIEVSVA